MAASGKTAQEPVAERWAVDHHEGGLWLVKTADGTVIRGGLTQRQAGRMANQHNGDYVYAEPDER